MSISLQLLCFLFTLVVFGLTAQENQTTDHFQNGMRAFKARNFDQAIASFQSAITLNPLHTEAYNYLGEALYEQGVYFEAAEAFRQALKLKPDYGRAQVNLEVVRWKLPPEILPPPIEGWPEVRLQLFGSYLMAFGAAMMTYLGGNLISAKTEEGIVPYEIGAIGFAIGGIEQVYLVGEEFGYGGGRRINVIAGALLCPLIGGIIADQRPNADQADQFRGAAYGALLSPIGAIIGYHLSKKSVF